MNEKEARINALRELLKRYDYIGTKIAMGRATREEYAEEIKQADEWAAELRILEEVI